MLRWRVAALIVATALAWLLAALSQPASAQVFAPKVDTIDLPPNVDVFNLSFDEVKKYSAMQNFELLGHTYFKIPERTAFARGRAGQAASSVRGSTPCGSMTASPTWAGTIRRRRCSAS